MSITLTNAATAASAFVLQAREISGYSDANNYNDSFAVLGGKRITATADTSSSSFGVTIDGGTGNITITGFYPMQRSTSEHIYLRTSLVNDNLGTKSMHSLGNHNPQVGDDQNTKGNMNYTFVIRVDIFAMGAGARPNELLLPEVPPPRQNADEYLITGKADRGRIKF